MGREKMSASLCTARPCVWLMIHSTHLKLVYLNYLSYSSLALGNGGEGRNGL